ncbi:MAG: gfo/Idh/MocA family oxidoreductase [Actinophytocola sp.]|nr:gfo/Idh/MocA family oxidoreductase [Actinophytocola sp.]
MSAAPVDPRRRYAFVGTGHRAELYFDAILHGYADVAEPVALCDTNATRMTYYQRLRQRVSGASKPLPAFRPGDYEDMLATVRPDAVVVTTIDASHADYVVAALDRGIDVIVEKPLTVDAPSCRRIAAAARRSSARLVVTFNYRYSPRNASVKELLLRGEIGEITSVHFEWLLDTVHGADYFRRWHREKANSGGLFVHKATHHFDLVNWWLADTPTTVYAHGSLRFYGAENANRRGIGRRPERSHDADTANDPFALDLAGSPRLRALYLDAEREDGYLRDRDVFSQGITIEDNMAALVRYDSGASLTYSLNAHAPWEGYRVGINGTEGRLELDVCERASVAGRAGDIVGTPRPALDPTAGSAGEPATGSRREGSRLLLQRHWQPATEIDVADEASAHGGGDPRLLDDLFRPGRDADPLGRAAGYRDGVLSVLVGASANESLARASPVAIDELYPGLRAEPDPEPHEDRIRATGAARLTNEGSA